MITREIEIIKDDILKEVYKITGYSGFKGKNSDAITSSDDDEILDSYFKEALSSVPSILLSFGHIKEESETIFIVLDLPTNWNTNLELSLKNSLNKYIIYYICSQWFNLSKKEEVAYYASLCEALIVSIQKYLTERKKPTR